MTTGRPLILLALAGILALSACAKGTGNDLLHLRADGNGPDEFSVLPTKPLVQPKSYAELPTPTPGGGNLTDPTPRVDAVVALGGSAKVLSRSGIPSADQGIVAAASRYGIASDIRASLAAEDEVYRSTHRGRLLERWFRTSVYFAAYLPLTLDNYAELARLRRLGVRTPAAPPKVAE